MSLFPLIRLRQLLFSLLALTYVHGEAHDISLRVNLNKSLARVSDTIICEVKLVNDGKTTVSRSEIAINNSETLKFISASTELGNYDKISGRWIVSDLLESHDAKRLVIKYVITQSGPASVTAEVVKCSVPDTDSTPGNGQIQEDDLSYGSVTVPIVFCGNTKIDITANALPGFNRYQWKKDEVAIPGANAAALRITEPGNYSYLVLEDERMSAFSAPIIVERGDYPEVELGDPLEIIAGKEVFVTAKVVGGLPPYTYKWDNDINWDMKRALKKGQKMSLKVRVTDRRGCIATDVLPVTVK